MNKAELIDAIASGSKLTKADAGRVSGTGTTNNPNIKGILAEVARSWNKLTLAEQQSWDAVAVQFPFKNKFGDVYTGSGYQVFMKLNMNLINVNMPTLRSGPVADFPTLPPIEPPSGDPPELLRWAFTGGIPDAISIQVFACVGVQIGSGFRKGKEKQLISAPPNSTGVIDVTGAYQNIFGKIKPTSRIYFRFVPVSNVTGQTGVDAVIPYDVPAVGFTPKLHTFLPGIYMPQVPVNLDWIIPFRANGFNLTEYMHLNVPIDPAARWQISRNLTGPWVNSLSVPLNEMKQPRQNVFYLKINVAAPSLFGNAITLSSAGASDVLLGFAGQAIDQILTGSPSPFGFGDVYSGLYTNKQMNINWGALRQDIEVTLTGANYDRIQVSDSPDGPFGDYLRIPVRLNQEGAKPPIFFRIIPGATGALAGDINLISDGDITTTIGWTANVIDAEITSPESGGISYGASISGERNDGNFTFSAAGISTPPAVVAGGLVNCTIEFADTFGGAYSNPFQVPGVTPPTVTNKQVWYQVVPTAPGIWSATISIVAGGGGSLDIAIDGLAT